MIFWLTGMLGGLAYTFAGGVMDDGTLAWLGGLLTVACALGVKVELRNRDRGR